MRGGDGADVRPRPWRCPSPWSFSKEATPSDVFFWGSPHSPHSQTGLGPLAPVEWFLGPSERAPFLSPLFLVGRFGSPTKFDDGKKGTLVLTSLLEDLGVGQDWHSSYAGLGSPSICQGSILDLFWVPQPKLTEKVNLTKRPTPLASQRMMSPSTTLPPFPGRISLCPKTRLSCELQRSRGSTAGSPSTHPTRPPVRPHNTTQRNATQRNAHARTHTRTHACTHAHHTPHSILHTPHTAHLCGFQGTYHLNLFVAFVAMIARSLSRLTVVHAFRSIQAAPWRNFRIWRRFLPMAETSPSPENPASESPGGKPEWGEGGGLLRQCLHQLWPVFPVWGSFQRQLPFG